MQRLYILAFVLLIFGGLAFACFYVTTQNDSVPIMAPLANTNSNSNQEIEEIPIVTDAERQIAFERYLQTTSSFFPNEYDLVEGSVEIDVPANYKHILSVPFRSSKDILRVYTKTNCTIFSSESADCINSDLKLVKYNAEAKKAENIASITGFQGANYGGIFVPLAITPDNKQIVLKAWMGSPGAGGALVNLGYSIIPVTSKTIAYDSNTLPHLASQYALFYEGFGKVVSLEQSDKTFSWSQPGRTPNQGSISYHNLLTGEKRELADGVQTTYEILSFDEFTNDLSVQKIKYRFGIECGRSEKILDCATRTATNITIKIP